MYYSKDIESFGTGLKRIADACNKAGVKYEFKKMKSGFVVCFYRLEEIDPEKPIKADKKPIKAVKKLSNDERQELIVDFILKNGSITNIEARELLGLAESTTKRLLAYMVSIGILSVEGEKKARKYLLKKES